MTMQAILASAALLTVVSSARTTRADVRAQFRGEAVFSVYRGAPTFGEGTSLTATQLREYEHFRIADIGIPPTLGANVGLDVVFDDRYIVPLLGLGGGLPLGKHAPVRTSVDGSMVEVRPSSAYVFAFDLIGFGVRMKERRWMFAATFRTSVVLAGMNARVSVGREADDVALFAASPALRTDVEACRRLNPDERICLFVAPKLYEHHWLGGVSLGLRWEYGS
ncbi:hypothetical protein [Pendulispora albinea]|uniref:Uncharacterized protein n=1 Tax=Pendulispora albinea TaxID=2741071 RepID=A0ABZ2LXS9_9BACT